MSSSYELLYKVFKKHFPRIGALSEGGFTLDTASPLPNFLVLSGGNAAYAGSTDFIKSASREYFAAVEEYLGIKKALTYVRG